MIKKEQHDELSNLAGFAYTSSAPSPLKKKGGYDKDNDK